MAQKTTATITSELATWLADQLNAKVGNTKPTLYPDDLNTILAELYDNIKNINDSNFNRVDGITIANVSGLTTSLAGKQTADATILKQGNLVNNLTSTSTSAPLTAAQGKVLKDLVDAVPAVNAATKLDDGNANEVTAAELRTHLDDTTIHFTQGAIDHTAILNKGTNTHAQIDTHIADATTHFTVGSISHTAITDIGTNTHGQIDTHIAASSGAHGVTGSLVGTTDTQTLTNKTISGSNNTFSNIDHVGLLNKGTNTHAQIDTHIASTANPHSVTLTQALAAQTLAVTKGVVYVSNGTAPIALTVGTNNQVLTADSAEASGVKWAASQGETNTLASVGSGVSLAATKSVSELRVKSITSANSRLSVSADATDLTLTLNEGNVVHQNLSGAGTNTHTDIDNHISSTSNPHSVTGTLALSQEGFSFTKGRIYVADGTDLNSLAVGSNGQVLAANSATTTGLEWTADTGEVNTATNLTSSGVGVYDSKSSSDLRFRRIDAADSKVTVTQNGNKIDIGVVPSAISHQNLSGAGTNTHANIDSHIANVTNPHSVSKAQLGLGNVTDIKNNLGGTTAPTSSDDSGSGYSVGSRWLDTTNDISYTCLDASGSSAVWRRSTITQQTAATTATTTLTYTVTGTPDYAVATVTNSTPFGFTTLDEAEAVLNTIKNLQTRVGELVTKLQDNGIIA